MTYERLGQKHMFSYWHVNIDTLAGRVLFQSPANWFSDATLQEHWRTFTFPSRMLRRRPSKEDVDAFTAKCNALRLSAAEQELRTPVCENTRAAWQLFFTART